MAHQKREANSTNENWTSERTKGVETSAQKEYNVESVASQETNCEERDTSQMKNKVPMDPCILDEKATTNSKVSSEQEILLTTIEADAAEDKGCRHTMEDGWVVLLDASLESPGNLRRSHFTIYDGHGGCLAAEYAQKHLHENVMAAGLPRQDELDEERDLIIQEIQKLA